MYRSSFLIFLLGLLLSSNANAQQQVLKGATLYDGTGAAPVENSLIVVEQGLISCVGPDCNYAADAEMIHLEGHYVTPGLVDGHVHYAASGWFDTRPVYPFLSETYDLQQAQSYLQQNPEKFDRSYLCSGVTAVFDTGSFPWTTSLQEGSIANPERPRFVAAGQLLTHGETRVSETVLNNQVANGVHEFLPMSTNEEALASVAVVAASGASALKVWFDPLPPERAAEYYERLQVIADAAHRQGLQFIAHTVNLADAKAAVAAGADVLVHSVFADLVDEEFVQAMVKNDVVYEPTSSFGYTNSLQTLSILLGEQPDFYDPNHCIDPRTRQLVTEGHEKMAEFYSKNVSSSAFVRDTLLYGEEQYIVKHNLRKLHEAGATIATSTDAGNPGMFHGPSMLIEMKNMQAAGIPAADVLVMSTKNGAKALGLEHTLGTVEVGKNADLVVLSEDPGNDVAAYRSIKQVMRFGKLHKIEDLSYAEAND
ncbi:amidohydrolase family protein [Pseudidiomarina sp. 1APR75-15]|uniref:Amidohydrolase family protein n=1 Tax=Pseudidiomarina terrestris TaxID=2820060 RepID=A0ABT8ME94_9GAMM|nr:amidohydrolase family protein [Pseudidiomarina sp. 1APR75-15]MDN7128265.1 amidohydrolase family protein [Pseudidiomarina sp. 1APR75-15]